MRKCVRDYARENAILKCQRIWKMRPWSWNLAGKTWTRAREGETGDVLDSRRSRTQSRSKSVLRTSVFRRFCLVREKQAADEDGAQRQLRPQSCGQQRGRSQLATKEGRHSFSFSPRSNTYFLPPPAGPPRRTTLFASEGEYLLRDKKAD